MTQNRPMPPRTAAAAIAMQAHNINGRITTTLAEIDARLEVLPDGYPTQTIGASPPEGKYRPVGPDDDGNQLASLTADEWGHISAPKTTSVEQAALARSKPNTDREQLTELLNQAHTALRAVEKIINRNHVTIAVAQCDAGVGREGHIIWSNPTCGNYPSEGYKTCDPCLRLEDAWRVSQGLERRVRDEPHHSAFQARRSGRFTAA